MRNPNLSHKNNLIQKKRRAAAESEEIQSLLNSAISGYAQYIRGISARGVLDYDLASTVHHLNSYVDKTKELEKENSFFNWRSDFAGSVIPEFLYRIFSFNLTRLGVANHFSTRDSVVEVTLGSNQGEPFNVRKKNQDLCVGNTYCPLPGGPEGQFFLVPSIVFEVKTNIDINKLSGLDFSAERLKRSFPGAKYFLVTETVDFSLSDNYASTSIDEIYCLRKQMRSAARRDRAPLQHEVFESLLRDVTDIMAAQMITRGHVYERLESGRLIDG